MIIIFHKRLKKLYFNSDSLNSDLEKNIYFEKDQILVIHNLYSNKIFFVIRLTQKHKNKLYFYVNILCTLLVIIFHTPILKMLIEILGE